MKAKVMTSLLATLLALFFNFSETIHAQGPGCPARVSSVNPTRYQVVEVIPLAAAAPETVASQIRGDFLETRIKVAFQPRWLALLSSTEDGTGGICVDDLLGLQAFPSDQVYQHDFRFNGQIVPTSSSENVTFLVQPGENELVLTLTDLTAPAVSSSHLYLVLVVDPNPPPPTSQPAPSAVTPMLLPTETAAPTPTMTAWPTPEPTETLVVIGSDTETPSPIDRLASWLSSGVILAGLVLGMFLTGGLLVWLRDQQRDWPGGEIEVYFNNRPVDGLTTPIGLAQFKKLFKQAVVRLGGAADCDIRVPGANVPPVLCQFRPQRDQFGQVETVIDLLEPKSQDVLETRVLRSGDVVSVHPFSIVYTNYAEQERMVIGGYHV